MLILIMFDQIQSGTKLDLVNKLLPVIISFKHNEINTDLNLQPLNVEVCKILSLKFYWKLTREFHT